jgi:hypothetical protein
MPDHKVETLEILSGSYSSLTKVPASSSKRQHLYNGFSCTWLILPLLRRSDWDFWSDRDPTNGIVDYQTIDQCRDKGLVYTDGEGRVSSDRL